MPKGIKFRFWFIWFRW